MGRRHRSDPQALAHRCQGGSARRVLPEDRERLYLRRPQVEPYPCRGGEVEHEERLARGLRQGCEPRLERRGETARQPLGREARPLPPEFRHPRDEGCEWRRLIEGGGDLLRPFPAQELRQPRRQGSRPPGGGGWGGRPVGGGGGFRPPPSPPRGPPPPRRQRAFRDEKLVDRGAPPHERRPAGVPRRGGLLLERGQRALALTS